MGKIKKCRIAMLMCSVAILVAGGLFCVQWHDASGFTQYGELGQTSTSGSTTEPTRFANADALTEPTINPVPLNEHAFANPISPADASTLNADLELGGETKYDRDAALNYAVEWAYDFNKSYPKYANGDCANFVSQVLHAGGIQMTPQWKMEPTTPENEFDKLKSLYGFVRHGIEKWGMNWDNTVSWTAAKEHYDYFSDAENGYIKGEPLSINQSNVAYYAENGGIEPGDLMYFVGEEGNPHHVAIVSGFTDTDIFYLAHTESRRGNWGLSEAIGNETVIVIRIRN